MSAPSSLVLFAPHRPAGRAALGLFLALATVGVRAGQTPIIRPAPPVPPPPATGTAAITGTLVDAATGHPIAGAVVRLQDRHPGSRASFSQVTTPKGRFAFIDLASSDAYALTASKPGYLDGGYERLDPRGSSTPLMLRDGQWLRDVRLTMTRPGSITGAVMDERGEPIVGATVRLLPRVYVAGHEQWLAGAVAVTDDRGAYRIAGLAPGRYVVSVPSVQATLPESATVTPPTASAGTSIADLRAGSAAARERLVIDAGNGDQVVAGRYATPPPTADGQRTAYPIVFYPNASTPGEATPIDLGTSENRTAVDFRLQPARASRVSGVIQGPADAVGNLPLRLISVGLEELGQGSEAATTMTLADGRFTFIDVLAGSYVIEASHTLVELTYTSTTEAPTALPAPVPFAARSATGLTVRAAPPGVELSALGDSAPVKYWLRVRVEISDRDVSGLTLSVQRPVSMTGQIAWAPGQTPSGLLVIPDLEPADGRRSLGFLTSSVPPRAGNTRFAFDGLMAGEYYLRLVIASGVAIESITWNGQDYTDRPFDASAGRDFDDVVLTLTSASSSISGVVADGMTPLTAGAAVIAFPVDSDGWRNVGFNPTRLTSVLTTDDGHFRIDGLPKGEYYLLAVPAAQERAWSDPEFLAGHAARATRVRIERSDSAITGQSLSLIR